MGVSTTILVVDDEPAMLDSLAEILALHGFRVLRASDGVTGLELLAETLPDLIIADINMPRMNGYQLYQRLRERPEWDRIPFLFLTGKRETEDIRFAKELGADDYLVKPFTEEDLIAAVMGRLKRFRSLGRAAGLPREPAVAAAPRAPAVADLSERELQVLRMMLQGLSNPEIARQLYVEPSTIKSHVSTILAKLGVSNRVEAVRRAIELGIG